MADTFTGGAAMEKRLRELAEALGQQKLLRVGFLETAKYPSGESVAQVAFWNEYGAKSAPPRPFFRNAIAKNKEAWVRRFGKLVPINNYDVDKSMRQIASEMIDDVQTSISDITAPALSQLTLMIRKVMIGRTDQKAQWADVADALARLKRGEDTGGVSTKPLVYSKVMRNSVAFDIVGGD
jgi:hypothetical protein